MTLLLEEVVKMTAKPHWCYDCGCVVTVGCHDNEGRFIPESVPVSNEEIANAIWAGHHASNRPQKKDTAYLLRLAGPQRIRQAWENIALGKHIGTYRKWGLED